jgi:hypothetical protein
MFVAFGKATVELEADGAVECYFWVPIVVIAEVLFYWRFVGL